MKQTKKDFDAVKMMRDIRDRLSKKYSKSSTAFKEDMEKMNKKYGIQSKRAKTKSVV